MKWAFGKYAPWLDSLNRLAARGRQTCLIGWGGGRGEKYSGFKGLRTSINFSAQLEPLCMSWLLF